MARASRTAVENRMLSNDLHTQRLNELNPRGIRERLSGVGFGAVYFVIVVSSSRLYLSFRAFAKYL